MASEPQTARPQRSISRLIAYPLLLAVPVAGVYAGIKLGNAGIGAELMLASHHGTPIENWTLSIIALLIALFMYAAWCYGNRKFQVRPGSLLLVAGFVIVVFLFGAWGIYGLLALCLLFSFVFYLRGKVAQPKNS